MSVSKHRTKHKQKVSAYKTKLKEKKKLLQKLYIKKLNDMILEHQNKAKTETAPEIE